MIVELNEDISYVTNNRISGTVDLKNTNEISDEELLAYLGWCYLQAQLIEKIITTRKEKRRKEDGREDLG